MATTVAVGDVDADAAKATSEARRLLSVRDDVQVTRLANGMRVVTERMPEARSVTLGAWVAVGARDEAIELSGVSHFLEHLLFKGTPDRSARQIAEAVDAVGGEMNAFTAKEHTAYYARLPATSLGFGLDLLGDVMTHPTFDPDDIEAERHVILEELLLSEDEPAERVQVLCQEALFPDHPLGREVLGDHESVLALDRDTIGGFHHNWYRPANLVVSGAGDLDHDDVVAAAASWFPTQHQGSPPERKPPVADLRSTALLTRPTEQAHLAMGWRAVDLDDPDRYAVAVLNQILGAGMSSRLFQEIRERRGLAYSVYSYSALYRDAGCLVAYAGTSPGHLGEVRGLIDEAIDALRTAGVTDQELAVAKGYLRGSLLLSLEDSASRMVRLGGNLVAHDRVIPLAEHLDAVDAVDGDDVRRAIDRVLGGARTVAAVGPIRDDVLR